MFARSYFAGRYFAPTYFPAGAAVAPAAAGASYERRRARRPDLYDWRRLQFYVDACFPQPYPAPPPPAPPALQLNPEPSPLERRRIAARQAAADVARVAHMLQDAGFEVVE